MSEFTAQLYRVNGIDLNAVVAGHGAPVLLLHGFPDTHAVWRHQIPALVRAGHRVIAPDTRGCGNSQLLPQVADYRVEHLVGDIIGLLDLLSIPRLKVVAHDWGAAIAWQLVLRHPQRVERYLAMSVGHPAAYARGGWRQKLKGSYILLFRMRGIAEWLLRRADWQWLRSACPAEFPRWQASLSRPGRLSAGLNYYRANVGLLRPRELPRAQVPVVGIWSDGDRFLDEGQMLATRHWCDAGFAYERVAGANHWLQLDAPERVNALLLKHLR